MAPLHVKPPSLFFIFSLVIGLSLLLQTGCSNDFLDVKKEDPQVFVTQDTIYASNLSQPFVVEVPLRLSQNSAWRLITCPQWIDIEPKHGFNKENANVNFAITIKPERFYNNYGVYFFDLIFDVKGAGFESKTFAYYNLGNPEIEVNPKSLTLKDWQNGEITISNKGDGMLIWEITAAPDWLDFEVKRGSNERYTDYRLKYTVDAAGLEPGDYTGTITISNTANAAVQLPVSLKVSSVTFNGIYYGHELVQSVFVKETNTMVVLTKNPNQLMYFSPGEQGPKIVKLDRVPQCMALNHKGDELVISFSNTEISTFVAKTGVMTQTYSINSVPEIIEYGPSGYIYFLNDIGYRSFLRSFNIETNEVKRSLNDVQGIKTIAFIPDKNVLVSTRPGWSPDMLVFYRFHKEIDLSNTYRTYTYGYWLSEDKDKIFVGDGKVFEVPDLKMDTTYFSEGPTVLGGFDVDKSLRYKYVAHHKASQRFFVSEEEYYSSSTKLTVFNDNTLTTVKTYEFGTTPPEDFYNGNSWIHKTLAIYPHPDGTQLWLLLQHPTYTSYGTEKWSVRTLILDE